MYFCKECEGIIQFNLKKRGYFCFRCGKYCEIPAHKPRSKKISKRTEKKIIGNKTRVIGDSYPSIFILDDKKVDTNLRRPLRNLDY